MSDRSSRWLLAASGSGAAVLAWFMAQHSLLGARWLFLAPLAGWVILWIAGSLVARRIRSLSACLGIVFVLGAVVRIAAVTGTTPPISSDLYRYGWDARVQLAGVDPYEYPPKAPALERLRVPPWFPDAAGCLHIGKRPDCTTINRPEVRTIYPAVAEAWFDAVAIVTPGRAGSRAYEAAGAAVDEATVLLLAAALARSGRDPRAVAWYALSPAPVLEFAANGHVDGFALFLTVAALLALRRGRRALAGVLIGAATMVKLYPAVALVAGWRQGRWRMLAAAAAVAVLSEAPHMLVVGVKILGYLPGYIREEQYTSGGRFLLVGLLPVPSAVTTALAAATVVAVAVWVLRRDLDPAVATVVLFAAVIFVATPVQPWYAVTLGGLGALAGAPELLVVALAAEPYYASVILAGPHQVAIGRLCYGLALLAALIRPAPRWGLVSARSRSLLSQ